MSCARCCMRYALTYDERMMAYVKRMQHTLIVWHHTSIGLINMNVCYHTLFSSHTLLVLHHTLSVCYHTIDVWTYVSRMKAYVKRMQHTRNVRTYGERMETSGGRMTIRSPFVGVMLALQCYVICCGGYNKRIAHTMNVWLHPFIVCSTYGYRMCYIR